MRSILFLSYVLASLFVSNNVLAQGRKIDTTAFYGNVGYRVTCSNKKEELNFVSISPKGFKNSVQDVAFNIKGILVKILVDDLNDDGFSDLLLCTYSGAKYEMGNIFGLYTTDNATVMPVSFPDIYSDSKLREGYKGHDEFTIAVGSLLRSFPIYKSTDSTIATGGTRVVQYKIMPDANKHMLLKMLRFYEKPQS